MKLIKIALLIFAIFFLFAVIVARVKKVFSPDEMTRIYKVKIKKEFKVSNSFRFIIPFA